MRRPGNQGSASPVQRSEGIDGRHKGCSGLAGTPARLARASIWGTGLALVLVSLGLSGCATRTMNESGKAGVRSTTSSVLATSKFLTQCGAQMTQEHYRELLELTDNSTFTDFKQAAPRATRIAEIFAEAKDRRGIFASMYVEITKESVGSTERGEYGDNTLAGALVKRFAERYFAPLRAHLLEGLDPVSSSKPEHVPLTGPFPNAGVREWEVYYDLATNCKKSDLLILGTGVNNHMTVDLPYTLAEIKAPRSFEDDFMKFGNILIQKKRESTDLLLSQQNVHAEAFFDLFFLGKIIDSIKDTGTAATWGFQYVRAMAWRNSAGLQSSFAQPAKAEVFTRWNARQGVLAFMPHSNPNMKGTDKD